MKLQIFQDKTSQAILLAWLLLIAGVEIGMRKPSTSMDRASADRVVDGSSDSLSICAQSSLVSVDIVRDMVDSAMSSAGKYELEPELLIAIAATESGCIPQAHSHRGAHGVMQLMPATARWLGVRDAHTVRGSIDGGAKYMRYLLDRYDGNVRLALAAYNAGPAAVQKYNGVPPYRETREYVERVMRRYKKLRAASI